MKWDRGKFWTKSRDCPSKSRTVGGYVNGLTILLVRAPGVSCLLTENFAECDLLLRVSIMLVTYLVVLPALKSTCSIQHE